MSVMRHPWFGGFDWAALREGRMKAPYIPAEHRRRTHLFGSGAEADNATAAAATTSSGPLDRLTPSRAAAAAVPCGIQRLSTVEEGVCAPASGLVEGDKVVQRSALSGVGEGSVKRGMEGLLRDGASFETALGTVTTAEARVAADSVSAVAAAIAAAAEADAAAGGSGGAPGAAPSGSDGVTGGASTPALDAPGSRQQGQAQGRGMSVRFRLGVAECA